MSSLEKRLYPLATKVSVNQNALHVILMDGREIYAPLEWFPRLAAATEPQRKNWRLIGNGLGIHWEDIDEDISIASLLATNPNFKDSDTLS